MLKIPGDYGTGGGAITRLATALSAITRNPIKIAMIRAVPKFLPKLSVVPHGFSQSMLVMLFPFI